jgi:hypothetical protein
VIAGCLFVASCGSSGPERADGAWAEPAAALFGEVAAAYEEGDAYSVARFFTVGGSLDLRAWGLGVVTDPLQMADRLRRSDAFQDWFVPVSVQIEDVYLSRDGAIATFFAHDLDGYIHWVQLYGMGADGSITSRLYAEEFGFDPFGGWVRRREHELNERYVAAWASGNVGELERVYAPDAMIRDGLSDRSWHGVGELHRDLGGVEPLEPGPWPQLFFFDTPSHHEVIAFVQRGGSCPRLEARRWVLDDLRIVEETRFAHLPSVRRCELEVGGGWWDDVEVAPETDRFSNLTVQIEGREIELVNADRVHVEFVEWLMDRYSAAGLEPPTVAAIWFLPSLDCSVGGSFARQSDPRFEDRHSVTLCFDGRGLRHAGGVDRRWSGDAVRFGLHELAHVWMYDNLDDDTRAALIERAGLEMWRGEGAWGELGVEHAAETIAWGVAGSESARCDLVPTPSCTELTERYELLTGLSPATSCESWSAP